MAYTPIKTNDLEDVKLSYTTKQTFDILNNNASELDDRADRADAKFEAIEEKLDTIETDATKVEPSQTNGNIIINGTETPVYRLPQLTPSDVGADPAGTAASAVATHNSDVNAHSYIQGLVSTAQQKADDAYALAEGRENATSYPNYQSMVTALNAETAPTLKVGDNIYIETVGVPDLWVSDVLDSKASYTYTTDQAIVDALDNPSVGYINIGWYRLDELETAKVDLSRYVPTTTTVTGTGALGGGGALSQNRTITHNAGSAPNVASGLYKISTDAYSHVSGATAVATADLTPLLDGSYLAKANPTGTGALHINRLNGSAVGTNSVTLGTNTSACGNSSFAQGYGGISTVDKYKFTGNANQTTYTYTIETGASALRVGDVVKASNTFDDADLRLYAYVVSIINSSTVVLNRSLSTSNNFNNMLVYRVGGVALGDYSHAEGFNSDASGDYSHAEGRYSNASGMSSHAEGNKTVASGEASHAEGQYTAAYKTAQHVFGKYNAVDTEDNPLSIGTGYGRYAEIVGNGTSDSARSNARTLDWNGNEVLAGSSTATSFIKSGGTSSQFLKADGSVDSSSYATETYVDNAVGAIDQKQSFTFTATDARWSSTLVDGIYTLTFNASNTTGFVAGKIPLSCFNGDNEQVMATLGFTSTTVYIKSDTKFAGTIYVI